MKARIKNIVESYGLKLHEEFDNKFENNYIRLFTNYGVLHFENEKEFLSFFFRV